MHTDRQRLGALASHDTNGVQHLVLHLYLGTCKIASQELNIRRIIELLTNGCKLRMARVRNQAVAVDVILHLQVPQVAGPLVEIIRQVLPVIVSLPLPAIHVWLGTRHNVHHGQTWVILLQKSLSLVGEMKIIIIV